MRFKGLITIIIIGLTSLNTAPIQANEQSNADVFKPAVALTIKPLACVVKKMGEQCQMTITAKWQSDKPISACLFQGDQSLGCWKEQRSSVKQYKVSLDTDMLFSIKTDHGVIVAEQKIVVNASTSAKYRRRLRSQWSLF